MKKKRRDVFEKYNSRCAYCGDRLSENFTVDHIIPKVKGGTDVLENLNPCCHSCNLSKGNLDMEQWREKLTEIAFLKSTMKTFDIFKFHHVRLIPVIEFYFEKIN